MGDSKLLSVNVGDRFERWTVTSEPFLKSKARHVDCLCDCGNEKQVAVSNLYLGKSRSCGCIAKEAASARGRHWMSGSKIYMVWNRMLTRCYNTKVDRYPRYGGRGIRVCDEWLDFENFYADMGDIPGDGYSIGRIDNDGNYSKENCRWETASQQQNNTSRSHMVEVNGEIMTVKQASDLTGVSYSTLIQRARAGSVGDELTTQEKKNEKFIVYRGARLKTTEWFAVLGVPISSFYHYQRKGLSKLQVLELFAERGGLASLSDSDFLIKINNSTKA